MTELNIQIEELISNNATDFQISKVLVIRIIVRILRESCRLHPNPVDKSVSTMLGG